MNRQRHVWPRNYINYSYSNFKVWSPNRNRIQEFYGRKDALLSQQYMKAKAADARAFSRVSGHEGLTSVVNTLLGSENPIEEILRKAGLSSDRTTTVGTDAGLRKGANYISFLGAEKALAKYSPNTNISRWIDRASNYQASLQNVLNTVVSELAGTGYSALEGEILTKYYQSPGSLTPDEAKIFQKLLKGNMTAVKTSKEDKAKIMKMIVTLQKNIERLSMVGGMGSSAAAKEEMMKIAKSTSDAIMALSADAAEIAVAIAFAQADHKGLKTIHDAVTMSATHSGAKTYQTSRTGDLEAAIEAVGLKLSSLPAAKQKADAIFTFTEKNVSFSFGASVKRTTPRSMENYGVKLLSTSLIMLMDKMGVFGDPDLVNAIMNTAATHTDLPSRAGYNDLFPASQAIQEWEQVKNVLTLAAAFNALSGNSQGSKVDTLFLIINNKPYLISDIMEKILRNPGILTLNRNPYQKSMARNKFVKLNTIVGERTQLNTKDALVRSERTYRKLISAWQSQKASISLDILRAM